MQPRPPQHLVQPSTCHILLEQGSFDQQVAVVFTALMEGSAHDAIVQGAYSAPPQVNRDIVLQLMDLTMLGIQRSCRLFRDRQTLDENAIVVLASGHSLCIRIEAPHEPTQPSDLTDLLHFDDLSLMQAPPAPLQRPTVDQSERPAQGCLFNPNAPVFRPAEPNLWLFPEYIQELHTAFANAAFAWEGEVATTQVLVWFVDHRFQFPTCIFPRSVTLSEDFTDWEQRIKSAWQEYLQPELTLEIAVVAPRPPQLEPGTAAHIIVVQAPNDAWATSLVSTIDLNVGHQPVRRVVTTPERTTFEHIVRAVGQEGTCLSSQDRSPCALWYDLQRMHPGHPILGWTGFGYVLVIDDLPPQRPTNSQEEDTATLLQRYAQVDQHKEGHVERDDSLHIRFAETSQTLDRFDTHFTLPAFDLEDALQDHAHWLPQCLPWIRADWYAYDQPIDHISVYYDGSFLTKEGTAGAAAAAFVLHKRRWFFAGAVSAHLPSPEFGSYTAEVRAALLATKQAYDLVKIAVDVFGCKPSVTFHFDSLSVGKQAEGLWQAKKDKVSCHAIRSILRIMQTRWEVQCDHSFVPGHSGDPGNELVDTIALCAAQGFPLQNWDTMLGLLTNWTFVQALAWGWIFQHPSFSGCWSENTLCLPMKPTTTPSPCVVGTTGTSARCEKNDAAAIKLDLLTCNVLTLTKGTCKIGEDQSNPLGPTRLQSITTQLSQANVTIFALQETRLRTTVRLQSSDYFLWHAPANDKGQFGILIGFAKQQPFAFQQDGTPHPQGWFSEKDFAVIAADPRFLIIKLQTNFFRCIVLAVHAPHSGAESDSIEMFWQRIEQSIPGKYDRWPKVLLADANCRFGDCPNQHIGDHDAETSTVKSEAFCQFVATHDLFIPASFATCHNGPSGTWCHPNGTWTRNDIIGVAMTWPLISCRSWIDTQIDVSLQKDDHRPARVFLVCQVRWMTRTNHRSAPVYRRHFGLENRHGLCRCQGL